MRRMASLAFGLVAVVLVTAGDARTQTKPSADPVFVLETAKGTIEIRLFESEAPKSVAQIVTLAKRSFYRGQRFHRAEASLVQVGDPSSRDMSKEAYWGRGGSGTPIGVFERSKTRKHVRGTVALGHSGNPAGADSQFYIMKAASPSLDGKYAIIGQVVAGMGVVDKIQVKDLIKNTTLK